MKAMTVAGDSSNDPETGGTAVPEAERDAASAAAAVPAEAVETEGDAAEPAAEAADSGDAAGEDPGTPEGAPGDEREPEAPEPADASASEAGDPETPEPPAQDDGSEAEVEAGSEAEAVADDGEAGAGTAGSDAGTPEAEPETADTDAEPDAADADAEPDAADANAQAGEEPEDPTAAAAEPEDLDGSGDSADDTETPKPPTAPDDEPEAVTDGREGKDGPDTTGSHTLTLKRKPTAERAAKPAEPAAPEAESAPESSARTETEPGAERPGRGGPGVVPVPGGAASVGPAGTGTAAAPDANGSRTRDGGSRRAPSWARGAEGDPERTSQFVALKPLDSPAPAAPPARLPVQPGARAEETVKAPLPPLELLAELTNTAPAPETPRRTALRRVKIWTPILLVLAGALAGAQLLRPLPATKIVAAEQVHTVDGQFTIPWPAKGQGAIRIAGSGDIGTFGQQKPVPTASVAKVMTAYVILKGHPLRKNDAGPEITVDAKAVSEGTSQNESRIEGLTVGQKFSQQDMLKMLMIPSGNNAARLLARWDGGGSDEAAFVAKMNAAAKELGMNDTTYTDPSGLDAGTVSTATDQLKLAEAVMKDEVFRAIVALPSATIKGLPAQLVNNNSLLTSQGLSIRGIKTGSSTPAGGALMWAAYKSVGDETPLILGTLMEQRVDGPDPDAMNSLELVKTNSKKIIEAVRAAIASSAVVRKGETVGYVDDGLGGRTPIVATKDLNVIGVPGQQLKLTLGSGDSPVPHTAKAGTEVGVLTVGEGDGAKSVPVAVQGDLAEPSFGTRLTRRG
uniref:Serine hydrolase n=1 Tax=Streptomyces sp. NBC_00049 TaxID=2903617 RepID=A0AAU2JZZ5_9ACTN